MRLYGIFAAVNKTDQLLLTKITRFGRRFASSTFLLVIAAFSVSYVALYFGLQKYSDPTDLASLELPAWMIQFTETVPKYLTSDRRADVLLMGSSLVLSPASQIERLENRTGYACTYFENALKERTGKQINVDNVGVIAGMVCDQYSILRASIKAGRKPSFIIYGMAPRDLADNSTTIENSPTQQVLSLWQSKTCFLPESLKPEDIELCVNMHKLGVNRWLKTLRNSALHFACSVSGHKATLEEVSPALAKEERTDVVRTHQVIRPEDYDNHKRRYNPPNFERLQNQSAYLESMLNLCDENHIPILLVNMPLPDVNRGVIPKDLLAAYKKLVKQLADKHGCEVYDLDENALFADNLNNFNDCVHLNAKGGKAFFNVLSEHLTSHNKFKTAYDVQRSVVAERGEAAVF